jgi:preprotein translocase subunit SecD
MNRYPAWKYALIGLVVVLGALYALPNVFGQDPAIQVSARDGEMSREIDSRVRSLLEGSGLEIAGMRRQEDTLLVRFDDRAAQREARAMLADTLGADYLVALNLASAAPSWLRQIGGRPLNLGLDLRGGVHFLLEVDMAAALDAAMEQKVGDIRRVLREQEIRYRGVTLDNGTIRVRFIDEADRDAAMDLLEREYRDLLFRAPETEGRPLVTARLTETAAQEERESALEQNVTTLRNRVDELGIAEPVVTRQGQQRIVVQLPGVQDTTRAKEILGATATLEFRLVHGMAADWRESAQTGDTPFDAALYRHRDGRPVLLKREVIVTGDQIVDAASSFDNRTGSPVVVVNLNNAGANRMQDVTADHVGDPMAVVFIENRVETTQVDGELVKERTRVEEVVNIATINDVLSHRFQIEGLTLDEARDLSLLLRAGALTAPVEIIEERTIGPSLGQDNINQGMLSVAIGLALVLVFMAMYYRVFGLFANVALVANLVIVIAVLSALQATLTLPGIAGIVLTVGMAVDANVLIFERVREELRAGNSVQASIHAGYDRAIGTIADANVTTLIAALVLMMMGTGPIKGFAITLSIGIVASMFTAIMGTRALVNATYGGRRLSTLPI